LSTPRVFPKNTPHQVIAPNKVVELKRNSIVLEKEFEGSVELPFFVSSGSSLSNVGDQSGYRLVSKKCVEDLGRWFVLVQEECIEQLGKCWGP